MKKIYSIVLMAAMLLVGTSAWAATITVAQQAGEGIQYTNLATAFANANSNDVILLKSNFSYDGDPIWIGEATMAAESGTGKVLTLDLGGFFLKRSANKRLFDLTHGTLIIKNGQILDDAPADNKGKRKDLILVCGSTLKDNKPKIQTNYYSHLVIESTATINANMNAITIDNVSAADGHSIAYHLWNANANYYDSAKKKDVIKEGQEAGTYVYSASRGVAHGVRIDVEGTVNAQKYGIKANGTLSTPTTDGTAATLKTSCVDGYEIAVGDTAYAPFIYIHSGANVTTNPTASEATAVYASGYARWRVEGYCAGSTGLYAKSGQVEIVDATIESTNDNPDHVVPTGKTSGITGGGSAIVIESNAAYAGETSVTISGDTEVKATSGYAIEETVTTSIESKVEQVVIEGGTIIGGDAGAIIVSEKTVSDPTTQVVVYGGDITGEAQVGNSGDLDDLVPSQGYHTTEVIVDGKTVVVVSEGEEPDEANSVIAADDYDAIKWHTTADAIETLSGEKILTELEINEAHNQELIIAPNAKLTVGHVILGENAKITVKPGAKLIVTGKDGIDAKSIGNLVLESSQTAQALLLFNPGVATNRRPKATVEMSVAKGMDGTEDVWTRFAMPLQGLDALKRKYTYDTWIYYWDYVANAGMGDWALLTNVKDMNPWTGYTLSYNQETEQVYTFEGNLVGNANAELDFVHRGYNYFGNSYSSFIDAKTLVESLPADIDGTIYMWDKDYQSYASVTMNSLKQGKVDYEWMKDVAPMTTFILRLMEKDNAEAAVDYASALWSNPRYGNAGTKSASAPAHVRAYNNEDAYIHMVVTAANGKSDRIKFTESADYTDAYDRGYDAAKYMNTNNINVYATINGEEYSDVVTNTLEGKTISMQTMDDVNYTITFKNAEGSEYALLDKVTNQVIAIAEGNSYEFAAQPNSVVEGRFEIINVNRIPTAIDNTEVKSNVKGIYTLTGQFVGEDFKALPAGVYVVDGVKIVK